MISKNTDLGLLVLRISIGGLMLFHGVSKILHGISFLVENMGTFAYAVYIGEVLAPIAILVGFRTRIAAVIFAINCITAIAVAHAQDIFSISDHGGYANELLMLYLLGAIALFFTGAGKYAVSKTNNWD
ncbi:MULTISPECIES: DoxX family protein [unclassified Flavobacterium]|jgi:putative oxidoreductase|uniref:DoxX family protein n=1 Tax=unclassified Flavobacterium TaxID=196869 RepID=UPI000709C3AF|nr:MULTISPECIES: DoxX family protein [unclassified Flavobacterium]KRD57986.1 DoxX family protein [Flavobacterium sp. Root935]MDQ1165403.1 putative oxidoreductase [Flavobacterium sp. SORGH_AS_0622]TDX10629.1 putative oxidoreductase [Flavobacterium sp. S87F.05.LMB.W.Kidney.N]BDU26024.1 GntR family transcriptional regulator [Flavobacterium sp. GSB-24]